ncbi:hypothetical protein OG271_04140 [Micromonospora rifamycinica]|uniref:hypothetical protein n=1 Tax=Micromonospora rifamycinica TaxID=291594 RepID=UPI002E28052B|nr:hypothetical protein [Micromonospora rifamycinica]
MKHIADWWTSDPLLVIAGGGIAAVLVVAVLAGVIWLVVRTIRAVRGAAPNLKLAIGQALVQVGVTWAVVTGTFEFCTKVFRLPDWEAGAFATFLEAATWVTVGMIYDHGKGKDEHGKPNVGFGPAGPFFWLFSTLGGTLAVIAGASVGAMIGRTVIVVFGTCLWYLALLRVTRRSGTPSRFRWTPRAALVAIGALAPADQDIRDEHQEWQVRRMARAMRWANGSWPWSWLGTRMLTGRAEQASETVIAAARRRYAVAHVVVSSVRPDSEVMRRIIADVARDPGEPVSEQLRADLDEIRLGTRAAATRLRSGLDHLRTIDGIRMPAAIADQIPDRIPADWIARHRTTPGRAERPNLDQRMVQVGAAELDQDRTTPVDHLAGPERTSEVDQTEHHDLVHARTTPASVDQPPTSAAVPAIRTTPVQRATARVDRVRPVSPAASGEVPPRIAAMVRDLKRAYRRADIPGRRPVMERMGWTNHQDAQTAINLVRAERTTTTEES